MPINANIALSGVTPKFDSPLDVAAGAMKLQQLNALGQQQQMAVMEAQRVAAERQALADIYRNAAGPEGPDHQKVMEGMALRGLGAQIPAYRKTMLDADKDRADINLKASQTGENEWKLNKLKIDAKDAALSSLLSKPNVTHQDAIAALQSLAQQGVITPEQGMQAVQAFPGNPMALRQHLTQMGLQVTEAKARMELTAPKYRQIDQGGKVIIGTENPLDGIFTPNTTVNKSATPGDVLQANTSRANNRDTVNEQKRYHDLMNNQQSVDIKETPTGLVKVDKRTGASEPIIARDGKQLQAKDSVLWKAEQTATKLGESIKMARELIPRATASGIGTQMDKTAAYVGEVLPGMEEAESLRTIAGWMTSNVPRMEGPQSNMDQLLYQQMAGNVGNSALPASVRLHALDSLEKLTAKYTHLNQLQRSPGSPFKPTAPAAPASGTPRPPLEAFNR
jgi:hypothetical protein